MQQTANVPQEQKTNKLKNNKQKIDDKQTRVLISWHECNARPPVCWGEWGGRAAQVWLLHVRRGGGGGRRGGKLRRGVGCRHLLSPQPLLLHSLPCCLLPSSLYPSSQTLLQLLMSLIHHQVSFQSEEARRSRCVRCKESWSSRRGRRRRKGRRRGRRRRGQLLP